MTAPPRRFVRSAPGKVDPKRAVPIRITDMTGNDAAWWDARMGPHHVRKPRRADRYWSWSALLLVAHLVQLSKQRHCRPLVIWARADNGLYLRVAMTIVIENYLRLDAPEPPGAHFVWFLCAADKGVLTRHFGFSNPPSLGRVLLDAAMVLSENAGLAGRIGLHAARAGGAALTAFYRDCGLRRLAPGRPLPAPIKRRNDGRFFYADETTAAALLSKLDAAR
jgi:hypothetical protein